MKTANWAWLTVLIAVACIDLVSCAICETGWNTGCSVTCGGGNRERYCYRYDPYNYNYNNNRYIDRQPCAETCLYGHTYSGGSCRCPAYRTGSCCETCNKIAIANCHQGTEACGGTPDGISCTHCYDTYYAAGNNQGCLDCIDIDNCTVGHNLCFGPSYAEAECRQCDPCYYSGGYGNGCIDCIDIDNCTVGHNLCDGPSYAEAECTQCDLGYYSGGYGNGCIECTKVPNCKSHKCSNGTFSFCLECNPNYWLINNGTAEQFCFSLAEFPHTECQGPCMIVYEEALSWKRARDVCEARGGHLYVPDSNTEEDRLRNYIQAVTGHIFGHNLWFWIGGQLQNTDTIQWLHGQAEHVDRWGYPRPHATTESLCMGMDAKDSLLWNAYNCDLQAYFVCEESTLYTHKIPYVVG